MARRNGSLGWAILFTLIVTATAHVAPGYGKLSGVVVDPSGTPQMGATVWVLAEDAASSITNQLLTNQRGVFSTERLASGFYSVRVTLAGFLPSIERHVRVNPNLTTLLKIELDSVFTSFDRLRRRPEHKTDTDEWKWVLRTSAATRSVLQWLDGETDPDQQPQASEGARKRRPRGRVELTSGARRPGSVANLADSPATAFSYDQRIGQAGSLVLAGQMSYERSAAGSLAALWLPSREGLGPETSVLMRQAKLGPAGPTFRALRMQHADQLALGDRFKLHYGAEYVLVGLGPAIWPSLVAAQHRTRISSRTSSPRHFSTTAALRTHGVRAWRTGKSSLMTSKWLQYMPGQEPWRWRTWLPAWTCATLCKHAIATVLPHTFPAACPKSAPGWPPAISG